jgi:hypothetical protein
MQSKSGKKYERLGYLKKSPSMMTPKQSVLSEKKNQQMTHTRQSSTSKQPTPEEMSAMKQTLSQIHNLL